MRAVRQDFRDRSTGLDESLERDLRAYGAPPRIIAIALEASQGGAYVRLRSDPWGGFRYLWITAWTPSERARLAAAGFTVRQSDAYWPGAPSAPPTFSADEQVSGVQGAEPPAHLDTTGKSSPKLGEPFGKRSRPEPRFRSEGGVSLPPAGDVSSGAGDDASPTAESDVSLLERNDALQNELATVPYEVGDRSAEVYRPFGPVQMGHRQMVRGVARALRRTGTVINRKLADRLESCGQSAWTRGCGECGAKVARVLPITGCDLRVCVFCARQKAQQDSEVTDKAVSVVERLTESRCQAAIGTYTGRLAVLREKRDGLVRKLRKLDVKDPAGKYRGPYEHCRIGNLKWRLAKVREKVNKLAAQLSQLKQWRSWSWKFLTIDLRWDTLNWGSYSVKALRERLRELFKRASTMWREMPLHKFTALMVKAELSDKGHVHLHGLYKGPVLDMRWLNRCAYGEDWTPQNRIGTVRIEQVVDRAERLDASADVDLAALATGNPKFIEGDTPAETKRLRKLARAQRRAELRRQDPGRHSDDIRQAVRECVKYAVKMPTPLDVSWLGGRKKVTADPRLLANWLQATRSMKLQRHYGLFRPAMREARTEYYRERKGLGSALPTCIECGADQPAISAADWNMVNTERFAQEHPDPMRRGMTPVRRKTDYSKERISHERDSYA